MEANWLRLEKRHLVKSTANLGLAIDLYDSDGEAKYSDAAYYRSTFKNYGSLQGFTPREWNYLGRRMARM
jgi:hypothetical protein